MASKFILSWASLTRQRIPIIVMSEIFACNSIEDYEDRVKITDKMGPDVSQVLFGLYGEVGSVMATSKKLYREGDVYLDYRLAVVDELGDVLWYLAAVCRRLDIQLEDVLSIEEPSSHILEDVNGLNKELLELGYSAALLLHVKKGESKAIELLQDFSNKLVRVIGRTYVPFSNIATLNLKKTIGRFVFPEVADLPNFDKEFDDEERIPDQFEIEIRERKSGKTYMSMNGVFIGDPLTDNMKHSDDYRYHDVFHLGNAAILHWSPVFRALIKHKRKSIPKVDEEQDSGRPIVVEEGLVAWIFSQAKKIGYFENKNSVSFDILKTIGTFIAGYEVEQCPLSLWERAILENFRVFRLVRDNRGGMVIGNRILRTIDYKKI